MTMPKKEDLKKVLEEAGIQFQKAETYYIDGVLGKGTLPQIRIVNSDIDLEKIQSYISSVLLEERSRIVGILEKHCRTNTYEDNEEAVFRTTVRECIDLIKATDSDE